MPKCKLLILFTVVIATVTLFAATGLAGTYPGGTFVPWTSFTYGDCTVETASTFPVIYDCSSASGKCSKYSWTFTGCNVSHALMLIGQDMKAKFYEATCDGSPCTSAWSTRCDGTTDPSIAEPFGAKLIFNCNAKIDASITNELSLIFDGALGTRPTDMYFKGGQSYAHGPINSVGPACVEDSPARSDLLQLDANNIRFCLVENDPAKVCYDEVWASRNLNLGCSDIVGATDPADGEKLAPEATGYFKLDDGGTDKDRIYVASSEDACIVDVWTFVKDTNNATCIDIGGIPYCF